MTLTPSHAYGVAAVSGVALWLVTGALSGRREAWDSGLYWTLAYPAAVGVGVPRAGEELAMG